MVNFPEDLGAQAFAQWRENPTHWQGTVAEIAASAGFSGAKVTALPEGSNLVLALGSQAILKIYPPPHRAQFQSEVAGLRHLENRLSVETPKLLAQGGGNGWSWLIMSRLAGEVGSAIWGDCDRAQKATLLQDIGRLMAEVHALDSAPLAAVGPKWADFIAKQRKNCLARHRAQGLRPELLQDLARLLDETADTIPLAGPQVLLSGDWIPQNFMVTQQGGLWRLSGLIDFGDLRLGHYEYDFLAPSAMMCEGNPLLLRAFFDGYFGNQRYDWPLHRQKLMALMALHLASDFRNLVLPEWQNQVENLSDLAALLWPAPEILRAEIG